MKPSKLKLTKIVRRSVEAITNDLKYQGEDPDLYGHLILALERLPDTARHFALDECVFLSVGRASNGMTLPGRIGRRACSQRGYCWLILLDESIVQSMDAENVQSVIAHEVAHAVLRHDRLSHEDNGLYLERDACRLARSWGFTGGATDDSKYVAEIEAERRIDADAPP